MQRISGDRSRFWSMLGWLGCCWLLLPRGLGCWSLVQKRFLGPILLVLSWRLSRMGPHVARRCAAETWYGAAHCVYVRRDFINKEKKTNNVPKRASHLKPEIEHRTCQWHRNCLNYLPDSVSYSGVLTSSIGRAARVRFRAWVLARGEGPRDSFSESAIERAVNRRQWRDRVRA